MLLMEHEPRCDMKCRASAVVRTVYKPCDGLTQVNLQGWIGSLLSRSTLRRAMAPEDTNLHSVGQVTKSFKILVVMQNRTGRQILSMTSCSSRGVVTDISQDHRT